MNLYNYLSQLQNDPFINSQMLQVPEVKCTKIPITTREEVCNWSVDQLCNWAKSYLDCFTISEPSFPKSSSVDKPTIWLSRNLTKLQFCSLERIALQIWKLGNSEIDKQPIQSFLVTRLYSCWNLSEIFIYFEINPLYLFQYVLL